MPHIVIKPRKDVNEYIMWSTVNDSPASKVMTRDEAFRHLMESQNGMKANIHDRLNRADASGLSVVYDRRLKWDTEKFVRIETIDRYITGWVKFENLGRLADAIYHRNWTVVDDVVERRTSDA